MFTSSQRDSNAVRGDDLEPVTGEHILADSESLKGIPVFSTTGRRLGILDRVLVHRATGGIAFFVLIRRRLFGLLRERLILPQAALRSAGGNGGFIVEWPLQELAQHPGQETAAPAPAPAASPLRLDPARGDA